ncbi:hypothetical protein BDP27DRAFT_1397739 [Rhodocollybia butyracea]|uniref:Uncharacterized protein n=1 Tax=Rhodocollybia butyracea TaxID=206335 RepID=A0A9P5Q890_9AGAR|nr:hypothetical protein BDP27DRAFT_1397739 [Rhodocollybia butyracea]
MARILPTLPTQCRPEPLSCQRSQELGTKVTDPGWKQLLEDFMRFDEGDFKGLVPDGEPLQAVSTAGGAASRQGGISNILQESAFLASWQSRSSDFIENEATATLFKFNSDIYPANFNLKINAQSYLSLLQYEFPTGNDWFTWVYRLRAKLRFLDLASVIWYLGSTGLG